MTNDHDNPIEVFVLDDGPEAVVALRRPAPTDDAPPEALVGSVTMRDGLPQWDTMKLRDSFVEMYSAYMKGEWNLKPAMLEQAKVEPGAYVYVIDGRVKDPMGDVPFHDIVGWYKSDHRGRPIANSFEYNDKHRPVTEAGPSGILSNARLRARAYPKS